ncbi:hypothetical protein GTV32_13870 [Gordonia sp. SID5947]|uniref:hypothetical protein n=1 Tax=Gordonia sp. SID5947 TaxID=2690315 RepID=UPI0013711D26|nr:hypothetical protein [Gordonia sp. SID5947]MYR07330.1 hypothetical protein [Gordonia sp. SID5947]
MDADDPPPVARSRRAATARRGHLSRRIAAITGAVTLGVVGCSPGSVVVLDAGHPSHVVPVVPSEPADSVCGTNPVRPPAAFTARLERALTSGGGRHAGLPAPVASRPVPASFC